MLNKSSSEINSLGYREGFKVDQKTGQIDKLEYSSFLEKAEHLSDQVQTIKKEIKRLENQLLPERSGSQSESLKEMWQEMSDCEDLIKAPQTNRAWKEKLEKVLKKLEQDIIAAEAKLGLSDLQNQVKEFVAEVQKLMLQDKIIDTGLRSWPKEKFVDTDV